MKMIQQIFHDHAEHFRKATPLSEAQSKVLNAICKCRTEESGQHLYVCPDCDQTHIANSSCGNRHCPVCQNDKAMDWIYRQQLKQLPCTYFLATFTVPYEIQYVARANPDKVYRALFDASAEALKTLEADKRFVGCDLSWGRQMQYHPHIHYVIPGGGLSADRDYWIPPKGDFLVHVRALSGLFKGKFRAELERNGLLEHVPENVWKKKWVVHCKSVGDGQRALKYLGAYVFRVAISNARILDYDGQMVTFKYYKVGSDKQRKCTLHAVEFVRRYLQHVLPHGFMKVRHYGFLHAKCSVSIDQIREMMDVAYEYLRSLLPPDPPKKMKPLRCSLCSSVMKWKCFIIGSIKIMASP